MDVPLPWEHVLWRGRSLSPRGAHYVLTDFRLVRIDRTGAVDEIVIQDIREIQRTETLADRLLSTSTLVVHAHGDRRPAMRLRHMRRGAQLAALLELMAGEPRALLDAEAVRAALAWEPRADAGIYRAVFTGMMALVFISLTVVYLFWEQSRLGVLIALAAVYTLIFVAVVLAFRRHLAREPRPLEATIREINQDRSCIPPDL